MSRHVRLDVVLRLREMAEESSRANLADALSGHLIATRSRDQAVQRLAERMSTLKDTQLGGGRADALIAAARSLLAAGRRRDAEEQRMQVAVSSLLDARARLAEASRRREVVERLRDRILAEERLASDRRDMLEAAELASARHAWRTILEADQ